MNNNELTLLKNNFDNNFQLENSIDLNNKIACIENSMQTDSLGIGEAFNSIMQVITKVIHPLSSLGDSLSHSYSVKRANESLKNSIEHINSINGIDDIQKKSLINDIIINYKKQLNKESILNQALNEIDPTDYSKNMHDDDFLDRFFEYAGDVSNIDMQKIWSRILSNEIKEPKKHSVRLLDLLRIISPEEAHTFEKFLSKSLNMNLNRFILSDKNLQLKHNLSDSDLLVLREIGLIQFDLDGEILDSNMVFASSKHFIHINNSNKKPIKFKITSCTKLGNELANIILENNETFDKEVVCDFCSYLEKKHKKIYFNFYELLTNFNFEVNSEISFNFETWNFNYK